jgi:hypothetical protein
MPIDKHLQVALSDSYIDLSVHSPDARLRKPPSDFHRHHVLGFYRFRIAGLPMQANTCSLDMPTI